MLQKSSFKTRWRAYKVDFSSEGKSHSGCSRSGSQSSAGADFFFFLLNSTKELYSRNSRKGFPWALSGFLWKERLSPAPAVAGEAGMAGWSLLPGSVDEPLAGLLPAAGRAPHVPVLHPINLAALLAFASRLP